MNMSAKLKKDAFDQMIGAFCEANDYTFTIYRDKNDVYQYRFEHQKLYGTYVHHIHIDSFVLDNLYLRFKAITEEVEKEFDKIARGWSRRNVYITTSDLRSGRYPCNDAFAAYCKADVDATKRMTKFFDPDKTPEIKDVIFNYPATIVLWADGTKTVVKAQEDDVYDPEKGLAMAICKKIGGNKWSYYNKFKHWLKKAKKED